MPSKPTSGWPGLGWLLPTLWEALSVAPNSETERWSEGQAWPASVGLSWVSRGHCSLCPPPTPSQPGLEPQPLGEACKGCWVIPLGGSGWGLGWAPGVADLPGAARGTDLTGSHPPSPAVAGAEAGTNY